jgi:hypothetical protein
MLPYSLDAVEALTVEVDADVLRSVDEVGPWQTWCQIDYVEREYPTQVCLAPEVHEAVRKHAACRISLAEVTPVLKTQRGLNLYIERMEG